MRNNTMKTVYIGLVVTLMSSTSFAGIFDVEAKLNTNPLGIYTYNSTLDHKEEVVYEQSGAKVNFEKLAVDAKKNSRGKIIPANGVPGRNSSGYSKLIMKKIDEKSVSIEVDRREYTENNEALDLKYTVVGAFTKGSWTDLISDKNVEIKLTPEAKAISESRVRPFMAKVIKAIGDTMRPMGQYKGILLEAKNFKYDVAYMSGTKKELVQAFTIESKFKLY